MDLTGFIGSAFEFQVDAGTPHMPPGDLQMMPWPPWRAAVPKGAAPWSLPYRWKVTVPPLVPIGASGVPAMRPPSFSIRIEEAQKSMPGASSANVSEPPPYTFPFPYWYVPAHTVNGVVTSRPSPVPGGSAVLPGGGHCAAAPDARAKRTSISVLVAAHR